MSVGGGWEDYTPWKWRASRNLPHITHGIPQQLRAHDEEGHLYAMVGTDGCDYIHRESYDVLPHASFYGSEANSFRVKALTGDKPALATYQDWFQRVTEMLPGVHHYSWFDLGRKIRTYRDYWSTHWQSLYNIVQEDTPENNMFFDDEWSNVTDGDIEQLATRLKEELGGWVFHEKVNFERPTPHLTLKLTQPKVMNDE